jgi:hypothetical protein
MNRWFIVVALIAAAAPVQAAGLSGKYIEARTCDVWTAPCFANAEINLAGKHAVMGWKVDQGTVNNVDLKGLSVVAVVAANNTLGLPQTSPAKAVLIVDSKANAVQREALIRLAKEQAGDLTKNIITVQTAPIDVTMCDCKGGTCARLKAGNLAAIETRCLDAHHDKACGNEGSFYPPLAKNTKALAAVATEHRFTGQGFNQVWTDGERRSAYVGSFSAD